MGALSQADTFSLIRKEKQNWGLSLIRKQKENQQAGKQIMAYLWKNPLLSQTQYSVAENKSQTEKAENQSDHSWEDPVRFKKDHAPECICIPDPISTAHSPWQPSKKQVSAGLEKIITKLSY